MFITMEQGDILSRTAQYRIQYTHKSNGSMSRSHSPPRRDQPRRIVSVRHHDDGTTSRRTRLEHSYRIGETLREEDEDRLPQMPHEFLNDLPDFRVTTECTDDEETADSRHRSHRRPYQIGSLPFETFDPDSDDDINLFTADDLIDYGGPFGYQRTNQEDQHQSPSDSLAEACDAHARATQEAVRAVGGQLLVPHARFFIEKHKSKCTIRFDPPVSGRFILLKMWSSHNEGVGNIDIQSVIARGFAGPRYFPSVQLR